jgi:ligand-binding sensor domain-containing protein
VGFSALSGLTFDASGNLWVTNTDNFTVVKYVPPFTSSSLPNLTINDNLNGSSPTFDANGNLWIGSFFDQTFLEYQPPFTVQSTPIVLSDVSPATSIAFDASGNLWAANQNATVSKFSGAPTPASVPAVTFSDGPAAAVGIGALAFDAHGNLWVATAGNNTIQAYNATTQAPISGETITSGLLVPQGLAFTP